MIVMRFGQPVAVGLGILAGVLPLLYPERGEQMSFMVQAVVLLVSGVYYSRRDPAGVAPGRLAAVAGDVPAARDPSGAASTAQGSPTRPATSLILAVFAVVLIPVSIAAFSAAERWAKRTGRLKRQG